MRGCAKQHLDPDLQSVKMRNLQERIRRKIVGQDQAPPFGRGGGAEFLMVLPALEAGDALNLAGGHEPVSCQGKRKEPLGTRHSYGLREREFPGVGTNSRQHASR
jgi:hypothetical protein